MTISRLHINAMQILSGLCLLLMVGTVTAQVDFPLSNLSPGLNGYAVTAGMGNELERFPIEVLGLQFDTGAGFPLVLVKAGGDFIERSGGVAAGMSGSPVYLPIAEGGDALLGAIGFVFPSSDHRLALVTPIGVMRGDALDTEAWSPFGAEHFLGLPSPQPVSTPLLLSGVSTRSSKTLTNVFRESPVQLLPIQANGVFPPGFETDFTMEPGSAISVQLVRGDVTVAAIGTVTALEDEHILAFGHPLLGQGTVSFALAPAFVSYIVPSDVVPFKLANSGQQVLGSITEDRPTAIRGKLGEDPNFFSVTVSLTGLGKRTVRQFEVTRDERYYAPLIEVGILQIFDEALQKVSAGSGEVVWEITLANSEVVRLIEQVTDSEDIAAASAHLAAIPLEILAENVFQEAAIERVAITINYRDRQNFAKIQEVVAETTTLQPGEMLTAFVRLQPYRKDAVIETLDVALPEDFHGEATITFFGGKQPSEEDETGGEPDPILSYGELLAALRDRVQASQLTIEMTIEGETERLDRISFPFPIRGEETLTITIETPSENTSEPSEEEGSST
ncbi:MAG: hypothetical protein JSV66_03775 [Trueperaceae bacterium]|nr:MAG: hypothetical protein JSV66_03775 [Trueperaceae bacterium]